MFQIQNTWRNENNYLYRSENFLKISRHHKGLQQRNHNVVSSQWHPKDPPESTDLIKPAQVTHPSTRSTASWAGQDWPHSHLLCLGFSAKSSAHSYRYLRAQALPHTWSKASVFALSCHHASVFKQKCFHHWYFIVTKKIFLFKGNNWTMSSSGWKWPQPWLLTYWQSNRVQVLAL